MDAVIPYVNGMEPTWRMSYNFYIGKNYYDKNKFTDYGTLRFVLRGISEHMKFIDRIFLVVSSKEQVPEYVNTDKVIIVTHDQFIPKKYLPTFNSHTIESFLWNIPNLSEEFIYFNDDIIPINMLESEEFFKDGLPCINFRVEQTTSMQFNSILKIDNKLASLTNLKKPLELFLWPHHIMIPYLKSEYAKYFNYNKSYIIDRIKPIRFGAQVSQHYFSNCLYYNDNYYDYKIDYVYFDTKLTLQEFIDIIKENKDKKVICINDRGEFTDCTISETKSIINNEFYKLLPKKGIYEK